MPKRKNPSKEKKSAAKEQTAPNATRPTTEPEAAAPAAHSKLPAEAPDLTIAGGPIGIIDNPIRLPIFFNTNPAISSLSPAGAVVGGGDFTLTVLGSNFGSGSTVLWNGSRSNDDGSELDSAHCSNWRRRPGSGGDDKCDSAEPGRGRHRTGDVNRSYLQHHSKLAGNTKPTERDYQFSS